MTITEPLGLRERKRMETRAHLESAAVEIAMRDGLDHATVDAVSAAANVSPRTFFNYFDSKEDAILGVRDTEITESILAEHIERVGDAELVESIIRLLFTVFDPSLNDPNLQQSRIELVRRYPHLMARQVAQIMRMSEQLNAAILQLLARDPNFATNEPGIHDSENDSAYAEMLLSLCSGAFRVALREWMTTGGAGTREELETRAITLIREVKEKIK
jgi:AcrR family transcriptional regulator